MEVEFMDCIENKIIHFVGQTYMKTRLGLTDETTYF